MKYLFITGAGRSGTTLLDKILHNHPNIALGTQPFPNLYFKFKSKFLHQNNIYKRYAFGHLFRESDYKLEELNSFLNSSVLSDAEIKTLFDDMSKYSGQHMPEFLDFCRSLIIPGTFYEIYQQLLSHLATYFAKKNLLYIGTKEIWLEEFIPYFLGKNVKSINIIRDPRDVVTSLCFGKGTNYAGNKRPLLYILRQWRKSFSFCAQYQGHQNFAWIKYEDLVTETESVLTRITSFLKVLPYAETSFSKGLYNQKGNLWLGNSSFGKLSGISTASVASFKANLSESCIRYIESVCYPEMLFLNYEFLYCKNGPDIEAIRNLVEPVVVNHRKFEPDYSLNSSRCEQEIQRLKYFKLDPNVQKQQRWFIFPRAYQVLKESVGRHIRLSGNHYEYQC